jgi:protein-L-isoaspartate(D-aspartate) O-methyltransferase
MTIEQARQWFSEEVRAVAHLTSDAVVAALATVPREAFLGPGPWKIARPLNTTDPYRVTPDADVHHLYHDVVVAIDPVRQLNNGQPSALARWIEAAEVHAGDRVLHIGCGTGYYTAVFAEIVGAGGRVVAYEVDAGLAERARAALRPWSHVEVITGDASDPRGPFDAIFVNAGCTHARPEWLAALVPGGRLVIPLTIHLPVMPLGIGIMLRLERRDPRWPAQIVTQVGIYDCANARDPDNEAELRKLAGLGQSISLSAVVIEPHDRGPSCVAHLPGFCLQK